MLSLGFAKYRSNRYLNAAEYYMQDIEYSGVFAYVHVNFQWRSQWGGKEGRVPPLTAKNFRKSGKRGKNQENREKRGKKSGKGGKSRGNRGKIGKKRQKSGRFFHFAPPDR